MGKNFKKKNFLLFVFIFLSVITYAQPDCKKCGIKSIACYDILVQIPKPKDAAELALWKKIHQVTSSYIAALNAGEGKECLQIMNKSSSALHPDTNFSSPSIPPEHADASVDYIMQGDVSIIGAKYFVNLRLSSADNELIAGGTVRIDKTADINAQGAKIIADLLGTNKSIADIIYNHEKKRRDDFSNNMAFNPVITSSLSSNGKTDTVKIGEATLIKFMLNDCDESALTKRKIMLSLSGKGKLAFNEIETTDGVASINFLAPEEEGEAVITATYNYLHPSKKPGRCEMKVKVKIAKSKSAFKGTLLVKATTTKKEFNEQGALWSKTETEETYTTVLYINLSKKNYESSATNIVEQDGTAQYAPVNGSNIESSNGDKIKNMPVDFAITQKDFTVCPGDITEQLVLSSTTEGHGMLTDYSVSARVNLVKNNAETETKLTDSLLNKLSGGFFYGEDYRVFLLVDVNGESPNTNSSAPKPMIKMLDCKTHQLMPSDARYALTIPDFDVLNAALKVETGKGTSLTEIGPAVNEDVLRGLIEEPTTGAAFTGRAYSFYRESNSSNKSGNETEIKIFVKLTVR